MAASGIEAGPRGRKPPSRVALDNLAVNFSGTFPGAGIASGTLIVLIGHHLVHILGPRLGIGTDAQPASDAREVVEQPGGHERASEELRNR